MFSLSNYRKLSFKKKEYKSSDIAFTGLILLLILLGWGYFLNWGNIPFDFHDWAEVNVPRLAFIKDAVTKFKLPLHMPDASALRGVTDRFMALPDVILSPQLILLRWMDVGTFVLVNTWLLIICGYLGLLKLRNRFSLSPILFSWVCILFYFNGHIISHYAVGHITWGGYFLLGWFIEFVFELLNDKSDSIHFETKMSIFLFILFLQGSFHMFVWCCLFLGILAAENYKHFFTILKSGLYAALLSAVRIIPAAIQIKDFDTEFFGGYTMLWQMVKSFFFSIGPVNALNIRVTNSQLGWWEFDMYIGKPALLLLFFSVVLWFVIHHEDLGFPGLILPMLCLFIFSYGRSYGILRYLHIPLFSGERVSSRFLILPFLFAVIIGFASLQRVTQKETLLNYFFCLLLIPTIINIGKHVNIWRVTEAAKSFPYTFTDLTIKTVANHPDPEYIAGLLIGSILSLATMVWLIFRNIRYKQQTISGTYK